MAEVLSLISSTFEIRMWCTNMWSQPPWRQKQDPQKLRVTLGLIQFEANLGCEKPYQNIKGKLRLLRPTPASLFQSSHLKVDHVQSHKTHLQSNEDSNSLSQCLATNVFRSTLPFWTTFGQAFLWRQWNFQIIGILSYMETLSILGKFQTGCTSQDPYIQLLNTTE